MDIRQYLDSITLPDEMYKLLVSSLLLLVTVVAARAIMAGFLRKAVHSTELRRRWLVQTRNALILILLLGLVIIWAEELRTLALSIVAIAVAFVVATKELILCLIGTIIKSGSGSFNIGDRIQIKDFRGDVIDQNLLATTILEVGPGKLTHQRTGRMTVIPNSLFVSEPVINESFTNNFVLHVFTVPFKREDDWESAQEAFLKSANKHCKPYLSEVKKYMEHVGDVRGLQVPSVEPRVTLQVPAAGEIHLIVRFPAPAAQRSYIEQSIIQEVFGKNRRAVERMSGGAVEQ